MLYSLWWHYIFSPTRMYTKQIIILFLLLLSGTAHLDVSIPSIICIIVLYRTRSHFPSLGPWAVELLSFFPIKVVEGKCNPSCTLPHSLGHRFCKKYPLQGDCGPPVPPDVYSTQEGNPSWFPTVYIVVPWWLEDMGLTPGKWSGLLSRVANPGTTQSCLSPGGLLSWSQLTPYLPPEFCPLFLCVFCVYLT